MNIYVGNMPYSMSSDDLKQTFEEFGSVSEVRIVMDRERNRPKGFAFVDMPNDAEGKKAIEGLNGKDIGGRALVVNEARPKEDRPREPRY